MVTHLRSGQAPWAVCGEEMFLFVDEAPTCLGCVTGTWLSLDHESVRIVDLVSKKIATAVQLPPEYLGVTVTTTSNTIEVKPGQVLTLCSNTSETV